MNTLKTELEPSKVKTIWETIRQENKFFQSLLPDDVKQISEAAKTLKIFKGDTLYKTGEKLSWFGVILLGRVGVFHKGEKVYTLKVSDIVNYMFVLPGITKQTFDMLVLSPGYISIFCLSDLPSLCTKSPLLYHRLNHVLCLKSLNTISFQYLNLPFLQDNKVIWSEYPSKKVQDYISKVPELLQLVSQFFEKNEVKLFQAICKVLHIDGEKVLVSEGQGEGCVFVIVSGELKGIVDKREVRVKEREIIGFEQFFLGKKWDTTWVTVGLCDIIVMHRHVFSQIAVKSLNSAIRIYKAMHRMFLNYLKKNSRFRDQGFVVDVNPSLFFPPVEQEYKYKPLSFVDVVYNYNNLLPKVKEPPGQFLTLKFQKQAEMMKLSSKQGKVKREPEKYTKDYLKELLLRTESGYFSLEDELEDLILYRNGVSEKRNKLQEEFNSLLQLNQKLKEKLKYKTEDKGVLQVKMNLNVVMKDIQNLEEVRSSMKNPFASVVNRSFFDITNAQIKAHRENTIALKCVEKWKNFVKKRKNIREIMQKSRFWPND